MTPKQQERIKTKIKRIKSALAADKKHLGGFHHDGQGLRYIPPQLYLQLDDYSGGLRYFNWFNKNFPNDNCYPDFLFEWTIVLFKTGRLKEAEEKAFQTYCSDPHLFNKITGLDNSTKTGEDLENSYINELKNREILADFKIWLTNLSAEKNLYIYATNT